MQHWFEMGYAEKFKFSQILAEMFSCEFCEIFKNTFFL